MKQTLTFNLSVIPSTESKINVDAFDESMEAFNNGNYLEAFHTLLDYINPELRKKFGSPDGTEFNVPHGSIVVTIKIENGTVHISAPFLSLPEKGRIPLLRQVAGLNFNDMDLTQVVLREDCLYFEFACPLELAQPFKIYYVLEEICRTGDKYDDEFTTKFGAARIYEPKVTPFDAETLDTVYDVIQLSCKECLDAVKDFETERKFGFAWNVLDTTILKILYYAHPQGQLHNELNKAVEELDREDIPLSEVVIYGKNFVTRLQSMSKEELSEHLYFAETFISPKRRSNLKNIQENFENPYNRATQALEAKDYLTCCLTIVYKFYEMYYYNDVQDDVNAVVVRALQNTSAMPWDKAAPVLHKAMDNIIEGELDDDDDDNEDADLGQMLSNAFGNVDMTQVAQNMQQAMQQAFGGGMQEYLAKVQILQTQMAQGEISVEEYTRQVQELAAGLGNNQ